MEVPHEAIGMENIVKNGSTGFTYNVIQYEKVQIIHNLLWDQNTKCNLCPNIDHTMGDGEGGWNFHPK